MVSKLGAYQPSWSTIFFILSSCPFESPKAVVKGYTYVTLVAIDLYATTSPFTKNSSTSRPNPPSSTSACTYWPVFTLIISSASHKKQRTKMIGGRGDKKENNPSPFCYLNAPTSIFRQERRVLKIRIEKAMKFIPNSPYNAHGLNKVTLFVKILQVLLHKGEWIKNK